MYKVIMQDWFNLQHATSPDETTATVEKEAHSPEKHTHCAAVQDDFHWWHTDNNESEHSGKLMFVDTSLTKLDPHATMEQIIQVFRYTNFSSCCACDVIHFVSHLFASYRCFLTTT